jgi:hypothetical protein
VYFRALRLRSVYGKSVILSRDPADTSGSITRLNNFFFCKQLSMRQIREFWLIKRERSKVFKAIFLIFITLGVLSFITVNNATRSIESKLTLYYNSPGEFSSHLPNTYPYTIHSFSYLFTFYHCQYTQSFLLRPSSFFVFTVLIFSGRPLYLGQLQDPQLYNTTQHNTSQRRADILYIQISRTIESVISIHF